MDSNLHLKACGWAAARRWDRIETRLVGTQSKALRPASFQGPKVRGVAFNRMETEIT